MQRVRTLTEFRTMAVTPFPIQVFRDGKWQQIQTDGLVPGDLVSVGMPLLSVTPLHLLLTRFLISSRNERRDHCPS